MTPDQPDVVIYERSADAVSFALWMMRKRASQSATDQRIVRDLENVYFGLLKAGAHASGAPMRLESTVDDPHGLNEFIRAISR